MAPSETDLVNAARQHAPEAWDSLLKRYQLPLYAYVAEFLRDKTAAFDVVQETFVAAVRHIGTLRNDAHFASWLFGIAHQKCIQHWRRVRRAEDFFEPAAGEDSLAEGTDSNAGNPRTLLLQREHAEEFFALVERLSPPQRSALLLHIIEDFSLEKIAEISAVPLGTVKSRVHHAKRALRQLLEATTR